MIHRQQDGRHRASRRAETPPDDPYGPPIVGSMLWPGRLPPPEPYMAIVVVYYRGDHEVMWPHARHRVSLTRRPKMLYQVDLSLHQDAIEAEIPSQDAACPFYADVTIQWRVTDPVATVRHMVSDAAETLTPHVLHRIRGISRKYDVTDSSAAEDEVNDELGGPGIDVGHLGRDQPPAGADCVGSEYGLWTRVIARLTLDDAATEHKAKMVKLTWAIDEENAEHELHLRQERHRQRITADRMDVYRQIIAAGDTERFAYQLSDHPEDIAAIEKILREEQRSSRRDAIDFVAHMVDSGVVERWQVSDEVKEALIWIKEAIARVIPDGRQRDKASTEQSERRRGRVILIPGDDASTGHDEERDSHA